MSESFQHSAAGPPAPDRAVTAADTERNPLDRLFNARSIAIVGASDDLAKAGGRVLNSLLRNQFGGNVYPVNPARPRIQGLQAYPSLTAIGEPVDLVIIAVAAAEVENQLRRAIAAKAGGFVVFASGFAETGDAGAALQASIAKLVREAGVPMIGPNCLGIMNGNNAMLGSSTIVMADRRLPPGTYGFISQSGALGTYWLDMAMQAGIGVSNWVSTGNEAAVDLAACLDYLVEDEQTTLIGLYIEGVRDGAAFRRAVRKAFLKRKPILVLKSGRSRQGATAAASHTGALAGEDAAYQALFDQYNMLRVATLTEMSHCADMLLAQPRCPGRSVVIISVSGGAGVLMTDAAIEAGFAVPDFSAETKAALARILPSFAAPQNPIDLTTQIITQPTMVREILRAISHGSSFDGVLIFVGGLAQIAEELADALVSEIPRDRPCAVVWQAVSPTAVEAVRRRGIPVYGEITDAVAAMGAQMRLANGWEGPPPPEPGAAPRAADGRFLVEHESKALVCGRTGLRRPRGFLAENVEDVRAGADELTFPLVAKLQSPDILHKSGSGAIVLRLMDGAGAATAAERMLQAAAAKGIACDGVLVEEMVDFEHEFLVGLRSDPVFGPMLLVGRGGVNVELDPDVARAFLPVGPAEIVRMIGSLRCAPLLAGFRGAPACDFRAISSADGPLLAGFRGAPACDIPVVAQAVDSLARLYLGDPTLQEIEINPMVIDASGKVTILDALVRTDAAADGTLRQTGRFR